ncbi:hypothetical protein [Cryptosporangium phraense]|uniref:Lipoprotein n=1 Tax=Cryptosporangium phraense TaxID=2593070 RepID=A0A545AQB8_9ACTN|nr:hypothetical protein [Cryptosporangium phraense]TQS43490.1 hypothetical protein FL583_19905 [Cryptosporangium phraense]
MKDLMIRISLLAVPLLILAACGGTAAEDEPEVATLRSSSPSASPTPGERPLIRPDTSAEEEDRLTAVWLTCLKEHGHPKQADTPADLPKEEFEARAKVAEKACESKQPEQLWERSKRLDPDYADKLRDWITCIRAHGIDAWESDGFVTYQSLPPDSDLKKVDECEAKAFA